MLMNGAHFTRKRYCLKTELTGGKTRRMNGWRGVNAQFAGISTFDLMMNYD
jgi:hypothetical protein